MKTINVKYNAYGKVESISNNSLHFEQENKSLVVCAKIETSKSVRAYIKASNNNSLVTDEITCSDEKYSVTIPQDFMSKGTLYLGFEIFDEAGYIERFEPVKVYIDGFVNLSSGTTDNVYVVSVSVGSVETLDAGETATVENVGTKKDMILNFGIPRGEKGLKGDKGDTPIKGVDYFTDDEVEKITKPVYDLMKYYGTTDVAVTDKSYFTYVNIIENLTYGIPASPDKVEIIGLTDEGLKLSEIVVPYSIDGLPVEIIDDYAFGEKDENGPSKAKKIVLPNTIKKIGEYAFINCCFEYINIPDSVTEIGEGAFTNGDGELLENLVILCTQGSYAESYAKENEIAYRLSEVSSSVIFDIDTLKTNISTAKTDMAKLKTDMGDVETALDEIIEIQNTLIGGGN